MMSLGFGLDWACAQNVNYFQLRESNKSWRSLGTICQLHHNLLILYFQFKESKIVVDGDHKYFVWNASLILKEFCQRNERHTVEPSTLSRLYLYKRTKLEFILCPLIVYFYANYSKCGLYWFHKSTFPQVKVELLIEETHDHPWLFLATSDKKVESGNQPWFQVNW